MAFAEYNISSLTEIPSLVSAFATANGWDVTAGPEGPTLRHPNYEGTGPGGMEFSLSVEIDGNKHEISWAGSYGRAVARSPCLTVSTSPTIVIKTETPTKLFLISLLAPEPYVAMVIEYGYNWYRHLYLGFVEKIGDYRGGEVITGSSTHMGNVADAVWRDPLAGNLPFAANQDVFGALDAGGVHIDHAGNSAPWRAFRRADYIPIGSGIDVNAFNGEEVIGGFSDHINDGFVARGQSRFAGTVVITPVDLFATHIVTGNAVRFRPIGRPAGVRMVNIEDLEAQSEFMVGAETWHSFAARRKSPDRVLLSGNHGTRPPRNDTSFNLGYAYRSA